MEEQEQIQENTRVLNEQGVVEEELGGKKSSTEEESLSEEDLELISENLGRSGFRRLQQRGIDSDKDALDEPEPSTSESDEEGRGPKRVAKEELEKMFIEEESEGEKIKVSRDAPTRGKSSYDIRKEREMFESDDDDMADFIEEEEDSHLILKEKHIPKKSSAKKRHLTDSFGNRLNNRIMQNILEIFGDGTDYLGLVEEEDEEDDFNNKDAEKDMKMEPMVDGDGNDNAVITPFSKDSKFDRESLSSIDIPERIFYRDGRDRFKPEEGELEVEASWIYKQWRLDRHMSGKFTSIDEPSLCLTIVSVLRLFRESLLEVPTVATHRKEMFQHHLGLNDLWSIWDLDEQWNLLKRQKTSLLNHLNVDESFEEDNTMLNELVKMVDSIELLEIIADFIKKRQKYRKSSRYSADKVLEEFCSNFILDVHKFSENIQKQQLINVPNEPGSDPDIFSQAFVGQTALFKSTSQLLDAAVSFVSGQLGNNPFSHLCLRAILERLATITTTPTERGKSEIDNNHDLSPVKYLSNKPISAFQEDQFLLIAKGQDIGLLSFEILFPEYEQSLKVLEDFYGGNSSSKWADVRRMCLRKAIDEVVLPRLRRDIQAKLRSDAERWVVTASQYQIQDKLMTKPYDPQRYSHPTPKSASSLIKVMAISWLKGNKDSSSATMAVIVDGYGRVVEQLRFAKLDEEAWNQFIDCVEDNRPSCILVAGRSLTIKDLFDDIEKRLSSASYNVAVLFAEDDTARIYQNSPRGAKDWPDLHPLMRYCISVARRFLNPLFEICSLSEQELLAFDSQHGNLFQTLLGKDLRLSRLQRACINVVNLVGVDINLAVSSNWMRSPIQYVCGLGPVKSESLVRSISKLNDQRILSRNELKNHLSGPTVFMNCASFLRIPSERKSSIETDPLDDTRIHPENYPLARKMAADAMEMSLDDLEQEEQAVRLVMQQPERLNDLLLDEYAKELVKRGQPSKHLTLLDIKAELQNPYADLRTPLGKYGPSPEVLFEMMSGENERTLWVGAVVPVTITRASTNGEFQCKLESGLPGFIKSNHSLRIGQSILGKVRSIDVVRMQVDLYERRKDDITEPRFTLDPYYDPSREEKKKSHSPSKPRSRPDQVLAPQATHHPSFRNISRQQAESLLRNSLLGEVIFRPSSQGAPHLSLTWKLDDSTIPLFQHLDLLERSRGWELAGELYEELDEVVARFVEPVASYLRDVKAFPKFRSLPTSGREESRRMVESYLEGERRKDPNRIAYCLSLSREYPGYLLLSFQPSSRAYHEIVQVTPHGYRFKGQRFDRVDQLITWFKQNYRKQ